MPQTLANTHIETQRRLRELTVRGVAQAWATLPSYDESDVPAFLAIVAPLVIAAQRQSVALTNAYLARALGRQPLPLATEDLIGAALRGGAAPAEVYRRPFVTTWTALKEGKPYDQAVRNGLERATSTAAMDVQLAMRATATDIFEADPKVIGYRRIPNSGACDLCLIAAQNRYTTGALMPIHNHCGCGVSPITAKHDPIGDGDLIDRLADMRRRGAQDDHTDKRTISRARERGTAARAQARELRTQADAATNSRSAGALRRRATAAAKKATAADREITDSQARLAARAQARRQPDTPIHGEVGPVLVPHGQTFTEL